VGYEEGGQLTEAVRRKPYSVILFDEIEKAHHDVFNVLLQILDDGRATDSQGHVVDFKNTVIISSNTGSHHLTLDLTDEARTLIAERGFDPVYGARPLKRYLQRELETKVGRALVGGEVGEGARLRVAVKDGGLDVSGADRRNSA